MVWFIILGFWGWMKLTVILLKSVVLLANTILSSLLLLLWFRDIFDFFLFLYFCKLSFYWFFVVKDNLYWTGDFYFEWMDNLFWFCLITLFILVLLALIKLIVRRFNCFYEILLEFCLDFDGDSLLLVIEKSKIFFLRKLCWT